jgi:thioredoxin 2
MSYTRIHQCTSCGAQNRVPAQHLADTGRCAVCKASLEPTAEPLSVGESGFDDIVGSARVPVLVDFWAAWCGPCRTAAPEVHKVASNMAGRAIVLKVNTEEQPELAARFGVQAIPNFVVLSGGKTVMQQPGLVDHRVMQGWLENASRPET